MGKPQLELHSFFSAIRIKPSEFKAATRRGTEAASDLVDIQTLRGMCGSECCAALYDRLSSCGITEISRGHAESPKRDGMSMSKEKHVEQQGSGKAIYSLQVGSDKNIVWTQIQEHEVKDNQLQGEKRV